MFGMGKKEYHGKMEENLRALGAKIDELIAKAKETDYGEKLEELKGKQQAAAKKLKEIGSASEEAWGDLKTGADKAWTDLTKSFEKARAHFK